MGAGTKTSVSRIATIVVIIPLLILAWYVAPLFMPVWRWRFIDAEKIAKDKNIPLTQLQTIYTMDVRYAPRGEDKRDPSPWQIITSNPPWSTVTGKPEDDENKVLVRCTLLSERTGEPPDAFIYGSGGVGGYKDRYLRITGWRFPPGSFGKNATRPVVVYSGYDRIDLGQIQGYEMDLRNNREWETDDEWASRLDDFTPAERQ